MIKKLSIAFIMLSIFNMQADSILEYIPVASQVRAYCLAHQYEANTVVIEKYLKKARSLTSYPDIIRKLDRLIVEKERRVTEMLEKELLLQGRIDSKTAEYAALQKSLLQADIMLLEEQRAKLVEQCVLLNDIKKEEELTTAVKNILDSLNIWDKRKEYAYIAEALENVYNGKRPSNTYTTKEIVLPIVGKTMLFSGLAVFSYLLGCAASNLDPSEPIVGIYNVFFK